MASKEFMDIMKRADSLSPDEQLELISHLAQQARQAYGEPKPHRKWSDIMGIAPNLLNGEDAQEWVSRTRRESDESRARHLKRSSTEVTP
jgi:hypothetical protein